MTKRQDAPAQNPGSADDKFDLANMTTQEVAAELLRRHQALEARAAMRGQAPEPPVSLADIIPAEMRRGGRSDITGSAAAPGPASPIAAAFHRAASGSPGDPARRRRQAHRWRFWHRLRLGHAGGCGGDGGGAGDRDRVLPQPASADAAA